jgi:type I restriction enzyme M protein
LAAYDFLTSHYSLDRKQSRFLKNKTFGGNEIVAGTRRLALMNMFLHNIGEIDGEPMISNSDALIADSGYRYSLDL